MKGLFVSYRGFLAEGRGGGVQVCTREYVDVIRAAGFDLALVPFESDRRLSTRLLRRWTSSPYFRPAPPSLLQELERRAVEDAPDVVFLNQVALASLAPRIRQVMPHARIVVLSHGLESTDLLHLIRLRPRLPLSGRLRPTPRLALGTVLLEESRNRQDVDLVCTLSPFDAELEGWMGARSVRFLPRTCRPDPLAWAPTGDRVGYLGTLDHGPNLEGLVDALDALEGAAPTSLRVRVVGGPPRLGRWLSSRYARVDYLGELDDEATRAEAATWSAFLHPIFCHARGCSTKLATAIAWQLPVVTTTQGHRGYVWSDGSLAVRDDPAGFAAATLDLVRGGAEAARAGVVRVAGSSPTVPDVAGELRAALQGIGLVGPGGTSGTAVL